MGGVKAKGKHYWIIKSKKKLKKKYYGECSWRYFAERCAPKNPRFATTMHWKVKWFLKKEFAEKYYFKKLNHGIDLSDYVIRRKKFYLDHKGEYDYWKNREGLMK